MTKWDTLDSDFNHVCNPNFNRLPAHNNGPKEDKLFDALDRYQYDDEVVDSYEAQSLLRATYHTTMGIFDHTKSDISPLALFVVHPNEDTKLTSRRFRRMIQYDEAKILTNYGVSWIEFQQLPLPEAELLIIASRERSMFNAKNQQLGLEPLLVPPTNQ